MWIWARVKYKVRLQSSGELNTMWIMCDLSSCPPPHAASIVSASKGLARVNSFTTTSGDLGTLLRHTLSCYICIFVFCEHIACLDIY